MRTKRSSFESSKFLKKFFFILQKCFGRRRADSCNEKTSLCSPKAEVFRRENRHPAIVLKNIGQALNLKGDKEKAIATLRKAVALLDEILGTDHPQTVKSREQLNEIAE